LSDPNFLPPYTEIVKLDGLVPRTDAEVTTRALSLARQYIARRPLRNPIALHRDRFAADLAWLRSSETPGLFHQYAFATFRQAGSCFEVASSFLQWLDSRGEQGLTGPIAQFDEISKTAKAMQFKLARAVQLKRDVDFAGAFDSMVGAWDSAMSQLVSRYGV
jgi:hypothetical protein